MHKELLFSITKKDFKIDWFSGTGAGGQHRNKHQNCVRLHHVASNTIVTGQSNRDRISNMKEALTNLSNNIKFKLWCNIKSHEIISGKTLDEKVEELLIPENIKVELKKDNKWILEK